MRTLLLRLSVSHTVVALSALALLLWLSPKLFVRYYLAAEQTRLTAAARGLARAAERLAEVPFAESRLRLLVWTSEAVLGGEVVLLGQDGSRIYLSTNPRPGGARWALEAYAAHPKIDKAEISASRGRRATLTLVAHTETAGGPVGAVVLRRRAPELVTVQQAQRLMTGLSAIVALILAVVLSFLLSRAVSAPLVTMSHAAERVAAEDFSVTVPERGPEELSSLASSLNRMALSLHTAFTALASERERLADVLTTMAEGVVGLDGRGEVTFANRAAQQYLGSQVRPGAHLREFADPDWAEHMLDALYAGSAQAANFALGDRFYLATLTPASTGGAVLVIADVSTQRRMEMVRREFVATASHELRAPLTSIRGFLGALLDGTAEGDEERERCLRLASAEASRMTRLVEELLELSRLQAGVMQFEYEPTQLAEVLTSVAQVCEPLLQDKQLSLRQVVEGPLPEVEADGDKLAQVFINLIDNAVRFSPPGSEITVRLRKAEAKPLAETDAQDAPVRTGAVECTVGDRGEGIPEAALERIFERFHKADAARRRTDPGVGLGLAIVREIIRAHGGDVFARNRLRGGAAVGFWLPLGRRGGNS